MSDESLPAAAATDWGDSLPGTGVLIGVDHGSKRIGLAVSDSRQTLAMPLSTLAAKSPAHNAQKLRRICGEYGAVGWVVGLPLHLSGDESDQSRKVRAFGAWLAETTLRPVGYWDERLSSHAAESVLWSLGESPQARSGRIDGIAAQVILEAYLRSRRQV